MRGCLLWGGVSAPRGVAAPGRRVCSQVGCVCSGEVSAPGGGGVSAPRGCLLLGLSAQGGVCSQGVGIPPCTEADTPPVDRQMPVKT